MQIQPLAGPLEGGTLVTIEGSNLGLSEKDVIGKVFIGDIPCHVEDYHISVKIICRTGPASITPSSRGEIIDLPFTVRVSTPAGRTESPVKFTYKVSRKRSICSIYILFYWITKYNNNNITIITITDCNGTLRYYTFFSLNGYYY